MVDPVIEDYVGRVAVARAMIVKDGEEKRKEKEVGTRRTMIG